MMCKYNRVRGTASHVRKLKMHADFVDMFLSRLGPGF
jgi:hypothetical protein